MLHDKRKREGRKQGYVFHTCTHMNMYMHDRLKKKDLCPLQSSFISHMVVIAIYNSFLHKPFCIPFAFSSYLSWGCQCISGVTETFDPGECGSLLVLPGLGYSRFL